MHALTTSNRLVRTALVLLALVLGLGTATVAVPSTAARAGGGYFMLCLPVLNSSGQIIGYDCRPFPYPVEIDPCPGCPDWAISLEHLVLPEDPYYVEGLNGGRCGSVGPPFSGSTSGRIRHNRATTAR